MEFLKILASIRNPFLDTLMLGVSYLGTPFVVCGLIGWFYLNVDKDDGCWMSLSFCYSCMFCQAVKIVARVPRPWNIDTQFTPVEAAVSSASGYSFPSIHTQSAASLFTSLFLKYKKTLVRVLCVLFIALVCFSRMYLGVHTPLDVFVGFLAGCGITLITWFFWRLNKRQKKGNGIFHFFLLAFAGVSIFLTTSLLLNGTIDYANASDSYKTAGMAIGFGISFLLEPHFLRFSTQGGLGQKFLRFVIALAGVAAILLGLKAIPTSSSIPLTIIRYTLTILWLTFFTPMICLRLKLCQKEVPLRTPKI